MSRGELRAGILAIERALTLDWSKEYGAGGGVDAFWSVREQNDGGLLFGGFSTRVGPGGINAYFAATTGDGTLLKENGYGTAGYDRITSLAPTTTGYLGVGHAEGLDGRDVFLIHVDKAGIESWRRVFAEPGSNGALYVEPAPGGGFVVAGGTSPKGDAEILVLKVDDTGQELWRRTVGQQGTDDINHGLAVLPDGRIVVTGYTLHPELGRGRAGLPGRRPRSRGQPPAPGDVRRRRRRPCHAREAGCARTGVDHRLHEERWRRGMGRDVDAARRTGLVP